MGASAPLVEVRGNLGQFSKSSVDPSGKTVDALKLTSLSANSLKRFASFLGHDRNVAIGPMDDHLPLPPVIANHVTVVKGGCDLPSVRKDLRLWYRDQSRMSLENFEEFSTGLTGT
jgi:hypothetical protein